MIVVTVEDFDVDAGVGHPSRELAELAWDRLLESLDDYIALGDDTNAGFLQRHARGTAIGEEEVGGSAPVDDPRSSTFDAHARPTQRVAHIGECSRPVLEFNGQVLDRQLRIQ